jgi:hypothetical protein
MHHSELADDTRHPKRMDKQLGTSATQDGHSNVESDEAGIEPASGHQQFLRMCYFWEINFILNLFKFGKFEE